MVPSRVLALALWAGLVLGKYDATVCGKKSYTISSRNLTFNPNAWNSDDEGFQCLSVQSSPPAFKATWSWSTDPGTVHSYPHVKLPNPALPVPLSNVSALLLSAKWSMGPGSTPRPALSVDSPGLAELDTNANVAFDIFADRNAVNALKETTAETEIMIWIGRFGHVQPLGYSDARDCFNQTVIVADVEFMLYQGQNARGTNVLTWMATTNKTSFAAEISPLLQYLWRNGLVSPGSNIGLVSFGTEAYHAEGNVTFSGSEFDIALVTGAAPNLAVVGLPDACSHGVSARLDGAWWSRVLLIMALFSGVVYLTF